MPRVHHKKGTKKQSSEDRLKHRREDCGSTVTFGGYRTHFQIVSNIICERKPSGNMCECLGAV